MKILIVACHPDDEVLGCGGVICKHIEQGDSVEVLIVTEASSPEWKLSYRIQKEKEQKQVDRFLGIDKRHFLNFPSLELNTTDLGRFNYKIYLIIKAINPNIIYTHFNHELHEAHNVVGLATLVGTRIPNKSTVYMYESEGTRFSWNSFKPNYYVQLNRSQLEKKIEAFSFYESEVKDSPHPRSFKGIRTQAKYRGDEIGVEFAEAFKQVKRLWL